MSETAPEIAAASPGSGNTQTVTIIDQKWQIIGKTADWARQQHPAWLTLWVVMASLGAMTWFGGRYIVNTAIPQHLASIKAGYSELWDKHLDDKKQSEALHLEDKRQSEALHREHFTQAINEMKRGNELLDSLVRELLLERKQQKAAVRATLPSGDGS